MWEFFSVTVTLLISFLVSLNISSSTNVFVESPFTVNDSYGS